MDDLLRQIAVEAMTALSYGNGKALTRKENALRRIYDWCIQVGSVEGSQQEHAVERAGAQRDQDTSKIEAGVSIERRQEEE